MTEDQLQAQCLLIARNFYDCLIFSIPNGAYTGAKEALKLKATGLTAGIPDLQLIYALGSFFCELKVGKNGLSQQQILIHSKLAKYNFPVYTIRSVDEFKSLLDTLNVPAKPLSDFFKVTD